MVRKPVPLRAPKSTRPLNVPSGLKPALTLPLPLLPAVFNTSAALPSALITALRLTSRAAIRLSVPLLQFTALLTLMSASSALVLICRLPARLSGTSISNCAALLLMPRPIGATSAATLLLPPIAAVRLAGFEVAVLE